MFLKPRKQNLILTKWHELPLGYYKVHYDVSWAVITFRIYAWSNLLGGGCYGRRKLTGLNSAQALGTILGASMWKWTLQLIVSCVLFIFLVESTDFGERGSEVQILTPTLIGWVSSTRKFTLPRLSFFWKDHRLASNALCLPQVHRCTAAGPNSNSCDAVDWVTFN